MYPYEHTISLHDSFPSSLGGLALCAEPWLAHDRSTDAVAYRQLSCWWCAGGAAALAGTPRTRHRAGVALSRRHEMAVGWCALHDLASGWQWLVRQQRLLRVEDRRSILGAAARRYRTAGRGAPVART